MEQIYFSNRFNVESFNGKTIKNFIVCNDYETDSYIIITFDDDTFTIIGLEHGYDEYSDILFTNLNAKNILDDFYKCCNGYTDKDGNLQYPNKIKKLIDLGILERDIEKENKAIDACNGINKLYEYRKYLRSEFEFNVNFEALIPEHYGSLEIMNMGGIKNALSHLQLTSPIGMIVFLVANPEYDENTFSIDIEMSNKGLVKEYNPYNVWAEFIVDIEKQWGISSFPDIDPVYLAMGRLNSIYSENDIEAVKRWKHNHMKMFKYQLLAMTTTNDKVSDLNYKISQDSKDRIVEMIKNYKVYDIFK